MPIIFIVILIFTSFCSCKDVATDLGKEGKHENRSGAGNESYSEPRTLDKQLNINILWDLSDRVDSLKNPSSPQQYEKDIEVIGTIIELFKKDMEKKGAYKASGKLRVFFTPTPASPSINYIAQNLVCDLSIYTGPGANKKKKMEYDSIQARFDESLALIYKLTVESNKKQEKWEGSDIWRFFKNDVKSFCAEKNNTYRNILVVLTDGYIYHKESKSNNKNRTTYILPETLKVFRKNGQWKELFDKGDYGLIATRNDLQDLEVLVLEVNPSKGNRDDEDYIRAYLAKWFLEMGIKDGSFNFYNSDLPIHTKGKIENFFN